MPRARAPSRATGTAAVVGALAVLVVAAAMAYQTERAEPSHAALDALLAAVRDIDAAARRFVLTGDESHVRPFRLSRERIPRLLERLREATAEEEWNRIVALDRLIDERVRVAEIAIATRRRLGLDATMPLIESGHGEHLTELIRLVLQRMKENRQAGSTARRRIAERHASLDAPRDALQNWSSSSAWLRP